MEGTLQIIKYYLIIQCERWNGFSCKLFIIYFFSKKGMQKLISEGRVILKGEIEVSGSKNSGLAIMAGALLCNKPVILKNLPEIQDIKSMTALMTDMGCQIETNNLNKTTIIDCSNITKKVSSWATIHRSCCFPHFMRKV